MVFNSTLYPLCKNIPKVATFRPSVPIDNPALYSWQRLGYDRAMKATTSSSVQLLDISAEDAGQRIDNFLSRILKGVPKGHIYRIMRKGEVRVNRGRVKPEYRLQAGDVVRVPPVRTATRAEIDAPPAKVAQALEASILYEDKRFLIINKPSGMAVHGGSGLSFGVIEALRKLRPQDHFLELAHRLDRDTSGCLLLAKKRSALRSFQELLRNDGVSKTYLALVQGTWGGGRREVNAPLLKNTLRSGERVVRVHPDGKSSRSIFSPLQKGPLASLMEVELITGRTHQVRVHAQHSGHPIAGDEKYGQDSYNRQMRDYGLKRLFLHARELRFADEQAPGGEICVRAPLDKGLRTTLEKLGYTQCLKNLI